ncbi:urea carboxylase [Marinospirillum perlucidum]|uniref:urea carboxylase n=1 Tax=Marinospirillum perlucidum TaxID=1982602 RepID=UPI000DF2050A|nr:urea carboxylase [Marinospirillum perlucidum]
MFSKVLIANRGAIAVRLLRSFKKLGIQAVAVYHEQDRDSLHVQLADEAWSLGDASAADTYLNADKLLQIAQQAGAEAIHPGYGFLSENADFVAACEAAGIVFIGPTPQQILDFGLKHQARALAEKAQVPLLPGSGLLADPAAALQEAERIGYPVMLKSTAGGGGIGMEVCRSAGELEKAFDRVRRLSSNNFSDGSLFLEKFVEAARHIEVQVFGDGQGQALALGERDCSSQRRNQKVVEECPAPGLTTAERQQLHETAERLLAAVNYRNAGTVEFIYDAQSGDFYFLEVNTRLQVEHGVTEEVYGVDLVEWMLRLAAGEDLQLDQRRQALNPQGHALQVRLYAEDPWRNFQPCPGFLSDVHFPHQPGLRVDTWIEAGLEIPSLFDPMLAKVIQKGENRDQALALLLQALQATRLYGTETNLDYLQALLQDPCLQAGQVTTAYLNEFTYQPQRLDVLQAGTLTTLQDYPGRQGYWDVGVPPSGPFDHYSFRLGNRLLGNPETATGLEITLQGPTLAVSTALAVAVTGAQVEVLVNDQPRSCWEIIQLQAGDRLSIGRIETGSRSYLCVAGGLDCPEYLGSSSTFTLGQFGGHNGRALRTGDVLRLKNPGAEPPEKKVPEALRPQVGHEWRIRVISGPHGAPDYFTDEDIQTFFASDWEVHYNSSRTGIRLLGPKPQWARPDGGEAGMHPSNIHDNAYAYGSIDFTGDMPVILGPDGPSLGGFVCPATVITADLWKLGQLRAGDRLRFQPVSLETAEQLEKAQKTAITQLQPQEVNWSETQDLSPLLAEFPAEEFRDRILVRAAGDHFLLVEYGEQELDLRLRFRAHALMQALQQAALPGIRELTPGVRSLQIHFDPLVLPREQLLEQLRLTEKRLASELEHLAVPSRTVWLPLSWDDEACRLAIEKYSQLVRKNAPWCPSNLEFIRRINGLESLDEVKRILFEASYLVMGLGDVYLGAPLSTPLDPRHRLVTTKYNPARTWTAENSVGIGGSYLCVYGMEGPGGYQFVGRTLQMWNRYRQTREFSQPWLLRFFDQLRFYEVSHDELQQIRKDFPQGRYPLKIEEGSFSLADYQAFLEQEATGIQAFTQKRQQAFDEELARWHADGQFNFAEEEAEPPTQEEDWPEGSLLADSPVAGSVWELLKQPGDEVRAGETLMLLESMKMEIPVIAAEAGILLEHRVQPGSRVSPGQITSILQPLENQGEPR